MTLTIFALVVFTMLLNTVAQLSLKAGMMKIGEFSFSWDNLIPIVFKIASSPWIIFGLTIYVISVLIWLMILSRVPVSIAYPMVSLAFIMSAVAAYYFLGEDLTPIKIAGIIVIIIGVYLLSKN